MRLKKNTQMLKKIVQVLCGLASNSIMKCENIQIGPILEVWSKNESEHETCFQIMKYSRDLAKIKSANNVTNGPFGGQDMI